MKKVRTLSDFKEKAQAVFDNDDEKLELYGITTHPQLKAYLIEANCKRPDESPCPLGEWKSMDSSGWCVNDSESKQGMLVLDASRERVWKLYSFLDISESDSVVIDNWIQIRRGLDHCWLSREQLLHWEGKAQWEQRGLGFRFEDGLYPEEEAGKFSVKAWHGANRYIPQLTSLLETAKKDFAIHSVRWQKRNGGSVTFVAEWYSNGKVTVNRAEDVDQVLSIITDMALRYEKALSHATSLRDSKWGAFEIGFNQKIDLNLFDEVVTKGTGEMKLWLVEVENEPDYRKYKGVDTHNWDRILLDVASDFALLTIPQSGCVNAAPRIATIQGEDNAGRTTVLFDGVELFA